MSRLFRSRWTAGALGVVVLTIAIVLFAGKQAGADETGLIAHATRGDFKVLVTTAGDLRAKNSVQIAPPQNTCMVGACQLKIQTIIPEGTRVREGDVIAELDRSPIVTWTNNTNLAMQKAQAVYEQAQLDTTLNLSKAREDLRLATTALEEKRIAKDQAAFEAPSTKRQAEIDLEKAMRALDQGKIDYVTRENQAKAKMREVSTDLQRNKNQLDMVKDITAQFTVKAPSDGMLIYTRDYSGKKRGAGSTFFYGEAALAELPDLAHMLSTTYVNEVDVRRVVVGQPVSLTLDSDPSKHLTGRVTAVANVGEERPNSDAKVFEVKIEVIESDTTLRPGMTTGNNIEVFSQKNVLSVPLEAVTSDAGVPYVYKKSGASVVKQEVETGAMNDTHVIIAKGLEEGDAVLLVPPADHATMTGTRLPGSTAGEKPRNGDAPATQSVPVTRPPADSKNPAPANTKTPPGKAKAPVSGKSGEKK